jgi:hypothetical protein
MTKYPRQLRFQSDQALPEQIQLIHMPCLNRPALQAPRQIVAVLESLVCRRVTARLPPVPLTYNFGPAAQEDIIRQLLLDAIAISELQLQRQLQ